MRVAGHEASRLARLPDMEPVQQAEPAYRPANFISGYESLPVRFTPGPPATRDHHDHRA